MSTYRLRKSRKILLCAYQAWRQKRKKLLPAQSREVREDLFALQTAILEKQREIASLFAEKCHNHMQGYLRKNRFEQSKEAVFGMIFLLFIAIVIRQVWFEPYEIPTGSMRPTLREKDALVVSKTDFGINIPFTTRHLYFDPKLVERSQIIVFTVEDLDVYDPDTRYFWLFPAKKQFVKRMMGGPGDTIYFYGGKLYGIDREGRDITNQLQFKGLEKIDYIPFIRFDGKVSTAEPYQSPMGTAYKMAIIHQMNQPVARLTSVGNNRFEAEMLFNPLIHRRGSPVNKNYFDLWGIGNYAAARIITKESGRKGEVDREEKRSLLSDMPGERTPLDPIYYLELKHHPDLRNLELGRDIQGRLRPQFILETSLIPLQESHLKTLFDNLYTARFVVKEEYAMRYSYLQTPLSGSHFLTRLEGIPDGTYEYYHGIAYEVGFGGVLKQVAPDHPLSLFNPELVRKLFNYGIDFDRRLAIGSHYETSRFAYFQNGDLFTMGRPLLAKGDPTLETFIASEARREETATAQAPYTPFTDNGPPITPEGKIDVAKIEKFGLLIPDGMYLALGDNFAVSADSRDFGFVPSGNLRGSPAFIFWPPGPRFGPVNQPKVRWFTLPNGIVWGVGFIALGYWLIFYRRHRCLPLQDL